MREIDIDEGDLDSKGQRRSPACRIDYGRSPRGRMVNFLARAGERTAKIIADYQRIVRAVPSANGRPDDAAPSVELRLRLPMFGEDGAPFSISFMARIAAELHRHCGALAFEAPVVVCRNEGAAFERHIFLPVTLTTPDHLLREITSRLPAICARLRQRTLSVSFARRYAVGINGVPFLLPPPSAEATSSTP